MCPECLSLACSTPFLTLDPFHLRFHCCLTTSIASRHCRCYVFVAFGVVWLFAVFLNGSLTAAGLCTGPIPVHFCGPHIDGGSLCALISYFIGSMQHATERVERPGESQEALEGKKGFKQQPICTPLAPTRNKIIHKTACSDGPRNFLKIGFAQKGLPTPRL